MIFRDVTLTEFVEETKNLEYVCVGCGQILDNIFSWNNEEIGSKIIAIADNNKNGQHLIRMEKEYKIFSVDQVVDMVDERCCIIISTMYCESIYNQLNACEKLKNISCYVYSIMSLRVKEYTLPVGNKEQLIPKKIHWFWFGEGDIPKENQKCIDSWKKMCPDYEIIKWTEKEYDISKCRYMQEAYNCKKWGFVPDYARLDVIYEYGGIYLDTDVELIKPLDSLLFYDAFCGFERNFQVALGLGFGARPKENIIRELRDDYLSRSFVSDKKMNLTASPMYQTTLLKKHGLKCNNCVQEIENMMILPTDAFDPKGAPYWAARLTNRTYSIHHYSESWVSDEASAKNRERYMEMQRFMEKTGNEIIQMSKIRDNYL